MTPNLTPVGGLQMCFASKGKVERLNVIGYDEEEGAVALTSNGSGLVTSRSMIKGGYKIVILPATAAQSVVVDGVRRQGGEVSERKQ